MVVLILHRVPAVGSVILLPLPVTSLWVAERMKDATKGSLNREPLFFNPRESYITHSNYSE
ncbi:hypothetical protein F896_01940 [Acinetobacter genomosp. 15BJ]|uniref:Uncharacterized protein n=1 Tax=Acinetobacter genomosp. 15BJ TaxID=106651 RepID=R9AZG3_9GAMM|nr:hypothetical protein F896_01940 [Acinetobacter genomosp. 15BJ]